MKTFLQHIDRRQYTLFFCCIFLWALVYSKFMISVSMIMLLLAAIFDWNWEWKFFLKINPNLKKNFQKFISNKSYLVITFFFFIVLLSGIYSEDMHYWTERLRIKLPFLLLPFAFFSMPKFEEREYLSIFYFFLMLFFVSALLVGFEYWQNYLIITDGLGRGRPIPTPCNHIRYSLMMAFSIVGGLYLFLKKYYLKYPWERWLILGLTIFLFGFIHVLSVRSGLVGLYIAIVVLSLRYAFLQKKYLIGIAAALLVMFLPLIAYKAIPGFKQKVDYTWWDWKQYLEDKPLRSSDAERMVSLNIGYQIGITHPILGVGAGDLRKEVHRIYDEQYPTVEDKKMPHNQLLSVFAGMGIVGLLVFCMAFFFPFFYGKKLNALFIALHLIIFFSFLTENTIENSIGVAFYVFFLLWRRGGEELEDGRRGR